MNREDGDGKEFGIISRFLQEKTRRRGLKGPVVCGKSLIWRPGAVQASSSSSSGLFSWQIDVWPLVIPAATRCAFASKKSLSNVRVGNNCRPIGGKRAGFSVRSI